MNDEARTELNRILAMEPAALTESDRDFLTARRTYLTEEQKTVFGVTESEEATASKSKTSKSKTAETAE